MAKSVRSKGKRKNRSIMRATVGKAFYDKVNERTGAVRDKMGTTVGSGGLEALKGMLTPHVVVEKMEMEVNPDGQEEADTTREEAGAGPNPSCPGLNVVGPGGRGRGTGKVMPLHFNRSIFLTQDAVYTSN